MVNITLKTGQISVIIALILIVLGVSSCSKSKRNSPPKSDDSTSITGISYKIAPEYAPNSIVDIPSPTIQGGDGTAISYVEKDITNSLAVLNLSINSDGSISNIKGTTTKIGVATFQISALQNGITFQSNPYTINVMATPISGISYAIAASYAPNTTIHIPAPIISGGDGTAISFKKTETTSSFSNLNLTLNEDGSITSPSSASGTVVFTITAIQQGTKPSTIQSSALTINVTNILRAGIYCIGQYDNPEDITDPIVSPPKLFFTLNNDFAKCTNATSNYGCAGFDNTNPVLIETTPIPNSNPVQFKLKFQKQTGTYTCSADTSCSNPSMKFDKILSGRYEGTSMRSWTNVVFNYTDKSSCVF